MLICWPPSINQGTQRGLQSCYRSFGLAEIKRVRQRWGTESWEGLEGKAQPVQQQTTDGLCAAHCVVPPGDTAVGKAAKGCMEHVCRCCGLQGNYHLEYETGQGNEQDESKSKEMCSRDAQGAERREPLLGDWPLLVSYPIPQSIKTATN